MSMKHRYRIWGWLAVMLLFIGCRQDEIWTGDDPLRMDYLQIEGEIAGAMAVRATPDNKLTMSYDTFGSGDTIGSSPTMTRIAPSPTVGAIERVMTTRSI